MLAAALFLAACTDAHSIDPVGSEPTVAARASLNCANAIDGTPPPADYAVIEDALGLPASPGHAALQAASSGGSPRLFAKTGLVVRAGIASEIDVPDAVEQHAGVGWNNGPAVPSRRFAVPGCPDLRGTGWLAYPGGFWTDEPLCLPLDVRVGDQVRRVQIGVGTACPGQAAPPSP